MTTYKSEPKHKIVCLISEIHECLEGSASCEHNCRNTAGAYVCSCFVGYTLAANDFNCIGMKDVSRKREQ